MIRRSEIRSTLGRRPSADSDGTDVQHAAKSEQLQTGTAVTVIQAFWRAVRAIRNAHPGAASLRSSCNRREALRKATCKVGLVVALLVAASDSIAENTRLHVAADDGQADGLLAVRESASRILELALPLVRWCDHVAPLAESARFLVPAKAPRSLHGRTIEASLIPAIAGAYLHSMPMQGILTCSWIGINVAALLLWFVSGSLRTLPTIFERANHVSESFRASPVKFRKSPAV